MSAAPSAEVTPSRDRHAAEHGFDVAAIRGQREVLSFACDPAAPVQMSATKIELLTDAAVRHGSRAPTLSLQGNDFTNDSGSGIRALARFITTNTVLRKLDVSMCRLGNYGASEISHACVQTRNSSVVSYVTHLNLSMNAVDDEGILRIGRIFRFSTSCVRVITLKYNPITIVGLGAFLTVDVPLQLLDLSHTLVECRSVEGSSGTQLQEVLHGLRRNRRTAGILLGGCEPYITPAAAGRMVEATNANPESKLRASFALVSKRVQQFHEAAPGGGTAGSVNPGDARIRRYVASCHLHGTVDDSSSQPAAGDDETTPRRSTHAAAAEAGFRSPLGTGATAASSRHVFASPAPPVDDEEWYERPPAPVPDYDVLDAIAAHDGPIVYTAVRSPVHMRPGGSPSSRRRHFGRCEDDVEAEAKRKYQPVNIGAIERALGVRHGTRDEASLHVDPTATGDTKSLRWAHIPAQPASSSDANAADADETGPVPAGRRNARGTTTANGARPKSAEPRRSGSTRQFRFLYQDSVPLIGQVSPKREAPAERDVEHDGDDVAEQRSEADNTTAAVDVTAASTVATSNASQRRLVDGRPRRAASHRPQRSASAATNGDGATSRSSSVATRPGDPYSRQTSARSSRATSPTARPKAPSLTTSERAVAVRRLLGLCAATAEQCHALLFIAAHDTEGLAPAAVVDQALCPNGTATTVLALSRPIPADLADADARPDVLSTHDLGSEPRRRGLAKLLWCLLHAAADPITLSLVVPHALDGMTDSPPHAAWLRGHKGGKVPQKELVKLHSKKRTEEAAARRVVERLLSGRSADGGTPSKGGASARKTRKPVPIDDGYNDVTGTPQKQPAVRTRPVVPSRFADVNGWVARRRAISQDQRGGEKHGPVPIPERPGRRLQPPLSPAKQ